MAQSPSLPLPLPLIRMGMGAPSVYVDEIVPEPAETVDLLVVNPGLVACTALVVVVVNFLPLPPPPAPPFLPAFSNNSLASAGGSKMSL